MVMLDIENTMRYDAFFCCDIITTIMFDCFPAASIEKALKILFQKRKWQISGMMMMCC